MKILVSVVVPPSFLKTHAEKRVFVRVANVPGIFGSRRGAQDENKLSTAYVALCKEVTTVSLSMEIEFDLWRNISLLSSLHITLLSGVDDVAHCIVSVPAIIGDSGKGVRCITSDAAQLGEFSFAMSGILITAAGKSHSLKPGPEYAKSPFIDSNPIYCSVRLISRTTCELLAADRQQAVSNMLAFNTAASKSPAILERYTRFLLDESLWNSHEITVSHYVYAPFVLPVFSDGLDASTRGIRSFRVLAPGFFIADPDAMPMPNIEPTWFARMADAFATILGLAKVPEASDPAILELLGWVCCAVARSALYLPDQDVEDGEVCEKLKNPVLDCSSSADCEDVSLSTYIVFKSLQSLPLLQKDTPSFLSRIQEVASEYDPYLCNCAAASGSVIMAHMFVLLEPRKRGGKGWRRRLLLESTSVVAPVGSGQMGLAFAKDNIDWAAVSAAKRFLERELGKDIDVMQEAGLPQLDKFYRSSSSMISSEGLFALRESGSLRYGVPIQDLFRDDDAGESYELRKLSDFARFDESSQLTDLKRAVKAHYDENTIWAGSEVTLETMHENAKTDDFRMQWTQTEETWSRKSTFVSLIIRDTDHTLKTKDFRTQTVTAMQKALGDGRGRVLSLNIGNERIFHFLQLLKNE